MVIFGEEKISPPEVLCCYCEKSMQLYIGAQKRDKMDCPFCDSQVMLYYKTQSKEWATKKIPAEKKRMKKHNLNKFKERLEFGVSDPPNFEVECCYCGGILFRNLDDGHLKKRECSHCYKVVQFYWDPSKEIWLTRKVRGGV